MELRVFLDAADIIRVADVTKQGADLAAAESLLAAFKAHDARLYVTGQLLQDLMAKVDAETEERVVRAFERFAPLTMTATLDDGTMVERVVHDVRKVLEFPGRTAALRDAAETNARIHEGLAAAMVELRASTPEIERGLSDRHLELYFQAILRAARKATSALVEFEGLALERKEPISEKQQAALKVRLSAADALLTRALTGPTDLLELLRPVLAKGPEGDGLRAIALFQAEYMKNTMRAPRPSDVLDIMHVENVERVDILTCDRHTMALMKQSGLDQKRATLLPTGRLEEVAAEIQRKGAVRV